LRQPIPENRTLVITIGTSVRDEHNNSLAQSMTVAVSTGERLDQGRIAGKVIAGEKLQGMMVGAWLVNDTVSIDPERALPPFLTQTGDRGDFLFSYLPVGLYRVVCWDDRNRNRLYQPGVDRIALPWRDIAAGVSDNAWIDFYPTLHDTLRLTLLVMSAPDNRHLTVRFNRTPQIELDELTTAGVIIGPTGFHKVLNAWFDAADSSRIVMLTERQEADVEYHASLPGDTTQMAFKGSADPDSAGPQIVKFYPPDGARDVPTQPNGWIGFSDAVKPVDFGRLIQLTVGDSTALPLETKLESPVRLSWKCSQTRPYSERCRLTIDLSGIMDFSDNPATDSTWVKGFQVIDPAQRGSITGAVKGFAGAPVIAAARTVNSRGLDDRFVPVNADGTYTIEGLQPDSYVVWAFLDMNENRQFDHGSLQPFRFAERFVVFPDTVDVRPRWETAGLDIKFR